MELADRANAELNFPEGFLWGVATSAHQVEGGNVNNDSWEREHDRDSGYSESSGDACDSFNRWPDDIELIAAMGLGAYRFSLEWSRIEPAEGEFSIAAMDYYRRICAECLERSIVPVVTFHHFTIPTWFAALGGWEAAGAPETFSRFVTRAAEHLGDLIGWACTINELNLIGVKGYDLGSPSLDAKDAFVRHLAVNKAIVRAHRLGVDALRSGPGDFPVGLTLSMDEMVAEPGGESVLEAARELWRTHSFGLPRATISSGSSATRVCTSAPRDRLPMNREFPPPKWDTSTGHKESSTAPGGPRQ